MMASRAVLLLVLVSAITANASDVVVTDCEACHGYATCHLQGVTPECRCKAGFVGDGLTCYNRTVCESTQDCCEPGYHWSSEQGCVDVDECSSSEQKCPQHLVCENTPGSFDCLLPWEESSHQRSKRSANPNAVFFSCGGQLCPGGEDCIDNNGYQQCLDPCQHYSVLNDSWRATDFSYNGSNIRCDKATHGGRNWQGWYRMFLGNYSVQMPERCIEEAMCGTQAPLWITSPHPALSDGIVSRDVCGHWWSSCCSIPSNPIHVKACPGNYFVYKFVDVTGCNLAYCADVNTTVCGTCSAHEKCVTDDQVSWRCEREERALPALQVVCGRSLLQVGLNKAALVDAGLDVSTAHLADLSCGVNHQSNSMVWFQIQPREGVCATQMRVNDTHATYSNAIFVYEGNQSFSNPESFPFSCVYSLLAETSLDLGIRPELNMESGVVGTGSQAMPSISLYRNADYTDPYSAGLIVLSLGTALHVGVSVQEAGATGFAVILEECYATPSADSDDPERFFLIQNRCPSDRRRVRVEESGPSLPGRFTATLSLFFGNYDDFFLHCSVSMCDPKQPSCSQRCLSRVARSVSSEKPLSIGPISCAINVTRE